jgi:preprotein translocase subunit YajC
MGPLLLQPSRGAGRAEPGEGAPAPAPANAETGHDAAPPSGPAGGAGGIFSGTGLTMLLPLLLLVGFMMFMSRSDKKRRAELENKLKKGDKVVTRAGFIGTIVGMTENHARVDIAPGVTVTMVKTAIEGLAEDEKAKAKDDKAKDAKESSKDDADAEKDRKKK